MTALLLLMGGSGERFGGKTPKQFLEVDYEGQRRPLFEVTARKLLRGLDIDAAVFVAPKNTLGRRVVQPILERLNADFPRCKVQYAAAGVTRHASFNNGLLAASKLFPLERLIVHDANRPYLAPAFLKRVASHLRALSRDTPAFVPIAPVVDSIVRLDGKNILHYENRSELGRVQTPQLIHYPSFDENFSKSIASGRLAFDFSDEGSLCLSFGMPVGTFEGDSANTKITFAEDLNPQQL